jgi:hypothetical protein
MMKNGTKYKWIKCKGGTNEPPEELLQQRPNSIIELAALRNAEYIAQEIDKVNKKLDIILKYLGE